MPFGYSEAPAELQKTILQILNPVVRQEKLIVYMDDIIPTETVVEENLVLIREIITTFKKYKFELNYMKCQFLKNKIEFLRYIISRNNIRLSSKHTEAINTVKSRLSGPIGGQKRSGNRVFRLIEVHQHSYHLLL